MTRVVLTVPGRFPGLNDYVLACKSPYKRAKMKREADDAVAEAAKVAGCPTFLPPVSVRVDCYERDARRDADNVHSMACKFVLDGLQGCGAIKNDNRSWVPQPPGGGVYTDRLYPRVEVSIEGEVDDGTR